MNRIYFYVIIGAGCLIQATFAQLPGSGNSDWITKWQKLQPTVIDESDPNAWMYGDRMYTGLAYDETRDVLYVVHPAPGAPQILILDPETGAVTGFLKTPSTIITGGAENGKFALYKVAVDGDGRIYACNAVVPAEDSGATFKLYRWNDSDSFPELIYEYIPPQTTEVLGTAFEVTGKRHLIGGQDHDSVRIYVSTCSLDSNGTGDDELHIIAEDTMSNSQYAFRLAQRIVNPDTTERYFGAGIAPTSEGPRGEILVCAPTGKIRSIRQLPDSASLPYVYDARLISTVRWIHGTIRTGALEFWTDPRYSGRIEYLFVGRMAPSIPLSAPNVNTVSEGYHWFEKDSYEFATKWLHFPTPELGGDSPGLLAGSWNWIVDVDFKIKFHTDPNDSLFGTLSNYNFYLSSGNGIGGYASRFGLLTPVELSSFTANLEGESILLQWSTASETNNYGFEIERSYSNTWERVGFVEGNGNTTAQQEYSWSEPITPTHKHAGTIKYRLRQVDYDGTFDYSPVVEVALGAPSAITLHANYPNPFTGSTSISYSVPTVQPVTLTVYNTLGQPVQTLQRDAQSGTNTVKLTGMNPGMYMVVLKTKNGVITQRIMGR